MTTYKASVSNTDQPDLYQANVRDFSIKFDLSGNQDVFVQKGMNPGNALLSSLGACESIVAASFYRKKHFDYSSLYLTLSSDDLTQEIHADVHFKTGKSKADTENFVDFIENTCPVLDNLANSVPLATKNIEITK